jgi:hypothetical protein
MTFPIARFAAVAIALAATATLVVAGAACRARAKPVEEEIAVAWRPLGKWSGQGAIQTESFISETGFLRVKWKTSAESPSSAGTFRATFNSAVSGRPIALAVETQGAGSDTAYVHEDPRVYYVVVESKGLEWSFTVEEGIAGVVKGRK